MSPDNLAKKPFELAARTAQEAVQKGAETAESVTKEAELNYSSGAPALYTFNSKLMEMAQANTKALLHFISELSSSKDPTQAFQIWSRHLQSNVQRLTEQSQELMSLGQKTISHGGTSDARLP
jgi:Phasin protein